ncbi:allose kinase [Winslowiella arboricola]|uniref:allose kinase n=1 Tax=Winslowiella arboricola TaxID=2978220 RepID=UPI00225E6231|nr:allose kinase [Winslowiella arboricola]MCU5773244.1 allose kinase [Winslowiella arboricola]
MTQSWLGIDIGGTSTRFQIMDSDRQWQGFDKIATRSWATADDALSTLAGLIQAAVAKQNIHGVMLGLPGILSRDRRQVLSLPFIQALDHQPIAQLLSEKIGIPVAMDKDVNHLMLWDLMELPQLPDNAVGIYPGTGLGNSLWLNGQFYHGQHGSSGELGHIPLLHSASAAAPLPCPCGNHGCVETVTSGHWLSNWAQQHVPDTAMAQLFSRHHAHPDLQAFVQRLAQVIAIEINILDPEYLILGGGVLGMNAFPLSSLREQIIRHLRPPATRDGLKIIFSKATDYTGCRGACYAAERHFRRAL